MPPSLPPGTPPVSAGHLVFELLSHVRACQCQNCQCQNKQGQCLRERIKSRATSSSSHGGAGPRETKSWCSRWLPVVPLFSEETSGGQQRPESAGMRHSAIAPIAPTPLAAAAVGRAGVERAVGEISSGARDATAAAALEERWANHWKAKEARATGLAPGTAAVPAALSYNACLPFAPPAHVAPSAPAAPAAYHANPAAPTSLFIPSASGIGKQAVLTEVLDGLAAEEEFEELLGSALL